MAEPAAFEIRPANVADAAGIAALHVRSWQAAYAGQLPQNYLDSLSIERRRRGWTTTLNRPSARSAVVVIELDAQLIGFAGTGPAADIDGDGTVGELRALYVDPRRWRAGAGSCLHREVITALRSDAFAEAILWVLVSNAPARAFYEARGWLSDCGCPENH